VVNVTCPDTQGDVVGFGGSGAGGVMARQSVAPVFKSRRNPTLAVVGFADDEYATTA